MTVVASRVLVLSIVLGGGVDLRIDMVDVASPDLALLTTLRMNVLRGASVLTPVRAVHQPDITIGSKEGPDLAVLTETDVLALTQTMTLHLNQKLGCVNEARAHIVKDLP